MRDMRDVGCRDPTVLTRVSEYMDVIVEYIEKIMANGFAYAANGSVYFDTQAFRRAPGWAAMHARACRAVRVGCVQDSEAVEVRLQRAGIPASEQLQASADLSFAATTHPHHAGSRRAPAWRARCIPRMPSARAPADPHEAATPGRPRERRA